jgi:hypothetical protein
MALDELKSYLVTALQQYVELTGIDPTERYGCRTISQWDAQRNCDELQELLDLDPTGLTAAMVLRVFTEDFSFNNYFSLHDLIFDEEKTKKRIDDVKALISNLEPPIIIEETNAFTERLKKAVSIYLPNWEQNEELVNMLNDRFILALLRQDSLVAMKHLTAYQFSTGPWDDNVKLSYNTKVQLFWNINSMIDILSAQPFSGVTLCLIRDQEAYHSYFAFAIKNGGNIFVITDKTKFCNPIQKELLSKNFRGLSKDFSKRAFQYHFPYQFLNFDGDGKYIYFQKEKPGLIPKHYVSFPIGDFSDLLPNQLIWLVMMLDQIKDKYWRKNRPEQIAYTGEMVKYPTLLEEKMTNLPAVHVPVLSLELNKKENITTNKMENTWAYKPTRKNQWMEDTYNKDVPDELLNVIQKPDKQIEFLSDVSPKLLEDTKANYLVDKNLFNEKKLMMPYTGIDPQDFCTKEEMEKNWKYVARYNQALYINKLAKDEFEEKKEETLKFLRKKIKENDDKIFEYIARQELYLDCMVDDHAEFFGRYKNIRKNLVAMTYAPRGYCTIYSGFSVSNEHKLNLGFIELNHYRCYVTGAKANVFAKINIPNAEALALICGCKKEEFPIGLQNYQNVNQGGVDLYEGNSNLQNIDPMEWVCNNPWDKLKLKFMVYLTKSSFNNLRKCNGLPKFTDWSSIEEKYGD